MDLDTGYRPLVPGSMREIDQGLRSSYDPSTLQQQLRLAKEREYGGGIGVGPRTTEDRVSYPIGYDAAWYSRAECHACAYVLHKTPACRVHKVVRKDGFLSCGSKPVVVSAWT